ncbi:MAG: flavin reductase family protein [Bacteroidales bacterium]|nr:flavin reductase family protein [Bacteroidales bacterium]
MKKTVFFAMAVMLMAACNQKQSVDEKMMDTTMENKEWTEIKPEELNANVFDLMDKDWMILSAGKEGDMNMMTIGWGQLGVLWNKPVLTVYVSTSRYTNEFVEREGRFTVTAFPEQYRDALKYLGSVSGRDEDKLKGSGFTAEFTENGSPIYKEANLAIECKKIYTQQFDQSLLRDEQKDWYAQRGIGLHVMYIGEIEHIWVKE